MDYTPRPAGHIQMMTGYSDMSSGHVDMTNVHVANTWRDSFRPKRKGDARLARSDIAGENVTGALAQTACSATANTALIPRVSARILEDAQKAIRVVRL